MDFVIHSLPLIQFTFEMENKVRNFKIMEGTAAETSGGLLFAVDKEHVDEALALGGWVIGEVKEG